ncbi:MAG: hypothetical protein INF43_04130 [Alphaproteobacteria bacterium]|jgi:hypothetical protein|nr:hypothetical protein [Alphaproteobacteria bacterium]
MTNEFVPKVGQKVRVRPEACATGILQPYAELVATVMEVERDHEYKTLPNGGKAKELRYPIGYRWRGAIITFEHVPNRFRVPLSQLVPA